MTADVLVLRQPREREVLCSRCRRGTWNPSAICSPCADKAAVKRRNTLIDEAILDAARDLDGWRTPDDFHNAVLVRVCKAITGLERILAAGLYRIACGQADDLRRLVEDIVTAHSNLVDDIPVEHDGIPCWGPVGDACLNCRGINQQVYDGVLAEMRVLLGDSALRDLAQVSA